MENYSFIVDDGDSYVVMNTNSGDDAYKEGVVIKAGEPLNGFDLKAWEGQRLVIDGKHIDGDFATVSVADTVLVIDEATGKLKVGTGTGINLVVKATTRLTEDAVIAKIVIA